MTKKILSSMVVLVFLTCLVPLSHGAVVFQIGDRDGFGFTPEQLIDAVNIRKDPADTDGDGKLDPGEFLPEINDNYTFDECPPPEGDGFDHRTDAEKTAADGAQFTDVSFLAENDDCIGHIPMNTVFFEFDVSVLAELLIKSAKLRIIYADFDGDCPDPNADLNASFVPFCAVCPDIYADDQLIGNVPLTNPRQGGISKATFDVPVELLEDGLVTITFESADSIEFDVVTLRVNLATENVRPLVRLRKLSEALAEGSVPDGPAWTYTAKYRMRNKPTNTTCIWAPFIRFRTEDPGILLLNADGGPGGNGATFTPDIGTDVILEPGEKVEFDLVIGLTENEIPDFKLRVRGTPVTCPDQNH